MEHGVTPEEARILAVLGHELYASSPGTPLSERMREPQPGDLVLEVTDFGRGWDPNRIGRLVRIEGRPPGARYVISPLHDSDKQVGWRHCEFIALPTEPVRLWLQGGGPPVRTKYSPLTDYLMQNAHERIEMTFDEVEAVMGGAQLPPSARNPRLAQWWDNDPGNVQARAWLDAGYLIEAVDVPGQRVRFRCTDREDRWP